ncbi:MAG: hypothetical protein NT135_02440 [Candidatus Berkelbacteria bacterium]|nr:hypothetical protein [Candidatus Berkelbacteria bacterium]
MLRKSKSFGLVETLIACGILVMVTGATTSLGILAVHGTIGAKHKTEAYNLAEDALEQIKAGRDKVWENWGENSGGATWTRFWDQGGDPQNNITGILNEFTEIKDDFNSKCVFINHEDGVLTEADCSSSTSGLKFTRNIEDPIDVSVVIGFPTGTTGRAYKVKVTVSWPDYGQTESVVLSTILADWKARY